LVEARDGTELPGPDGGRELCTSKVMPFDSFERGDANEARTKPGFVEVEGDDNGVSVFAGD